MDSNLLTEVPSSLKQLARLVVRGFYSIEDALIVDMLVRNPCMREDDLCELLKFEKKMLRARMAILKNDKFLQVRLKMETGPDGKAQKVNFYFINYKTFVNVVKYKLDLMRKRMETEERDATSRASFKCPSCLKTFTDLEADQLFDMQTGDFHCTYCRQVVEEDQSALPKKDSRLLLAKFNEQLEPLYVLLREVEDIKLAPEVLEPEPVDISTIRGLDNKQRMINNARQQGNQTWSGEATRKQGFQVEETQIDVKIGDEITQEETTARKERPIWMVESTIISTETPDSDSLGAVPGAPVELPGSERNSKNQEDIMSVLLAHEKKGNEGKPIIPGQNDSASESSEEEQKDSDIELIETIESDEEDLMPSVSVAGKEVPLVDVNDDLISKMTPSEKEAYIQVYQEYYSHMYD